MPRLLLRLLPVKQQEAGLHQVRKIVAQLEQVRKIVAQLEQELLRPRKERAVWLQEGVPPLQGRVWGGVGPPLQQQLVHSRRLTIRTIRKAMRDRLRL